MANRMPPDIPQRRRSLPPADHVTIPPTSPEIISNLLTSLAVISTPDRHTGPIVPSRLVTSFGDSGFGVDYGAYDQPAGYEPLWPQESLDDLAAPPPSIRTAKPPSGFSPLTATKSPRDSSPFKSFLSRSSRPGSRSSSLASKDDLSSIGTPSVEPSAASPYELGRISSSDSWGKKQSQSQSRSSRGLMYMSSKEQLREREHERKRTGALGMNRSASRESPVVPRLEVEKVLAETAISEEPPMSSDGKPRLPPIETTSLSVGPNFTDDGISPATSVRSLASGAIPTRDSSLRKPSAMRKRPTQKTQRQSSKTRELKDDVESPADMRSRSEQYEAVVQARGTSNLEHTSTMETPDSLIMPISSQEAADKQAAQITAVDDVNLEDPDEGAPFPAVPQRKARSPDGGRASTQSKAGRSGTATPEPMESSAMAAIPKRTGSRLKRLSAPLSPRQTDYNAQVEPAGRKVSAEPARPPQIHIDDRPSSASSIDDAVEAYLCSPRLSQKIKHPQTGRIISFSEVGDSNGFAVFCCVGMGLTRYITAFYDELASTLKLRLITPDRPGVGESEPYSGEASPLSWPDDVYAICQALKITKFSILAHSAGAIYALATALRMPQHIRGRIHLLAPWIPPSQMNATGSQNASPPANSLPTSQRILRALPTPILKAANSSFMSATSSSITSSLPKQKRNKRKSIVNGRRTVSPSMDKENGRNSAIYPDPLANAEASDKPVFATIDADPEAAILAAAATSLANKERQMTYDTRLTHAIWDYSTSGANPAVDLLVCLERRQTIGFRYVDITRPVVIHHGSKDSRVPVDNVRWLGKTMKRCEVRVLEGEGHGLMASAAVMGSILMEIAREWEDWTKVTNSSTAARDGKRSLRERASVGAFR